MNDSPWRTIVAESSQLTRDNRRLYSKLEFSKPGKAGDAAYDIYAELFVGHAVTQILVRDCHPSTVEAYIFGLFC